MAQQQFVTWAQRAPVPVSVEGMALTAVDGKIYAIGGAEQRGQRPMVPATTSNLMYDPASDQWHERAPLPTPLSHMGIAELNGMLYCFGGFIDIVHMGPQAAALAYDPQADRWHNLRPLSSPRGSVVAAAIHGQIHIFGGRRSEPVVRLTPPGAPEIFEGLGTLTTHEIYDPATDQWSEGTPFPEPGTDHMGIGVIDEKIHLFGGRTAFFTDLLDRHDVYDPRTDRWTAALPLPRPRSDGAFTTVGGLIVYAGGECKPGGQPGSMDTFDDVTAFDSEAQRWVTLTPLPQACHGISAATVGDTAYFVGGACCCGGGTSTEVLSFTIDPLASFYGNTLNIVEPERTLRQQLKADNTFTAIDEVGNRINGIWERNGNQITMMQTSAPPPGGEIWKRSGSIGGLHKVGDRWERTRPDGARVYISLTAGE